MTVPPELRRGSGTTSAPVPTQRRATATEAAWPASLSPERLHRLGLRTPFLALDTAMLQRHVTGFLAAFHGRVAVRYAVKCNSEPAVLAAVVAAGGSFEIASATELDLALAAGATVDDVYYSNPVKPPSHVRRTATAGVRHFVVDGSEEIDKIAEIAPGVGVLVRVRVDDTSSAFPLSSKFGVPAEDAEDLLLYAASRGLVAAGLTFHVGSQCTDVHAWGRAVAGLAPLFTRFADAGTPLRVLDIGGGFPARYDDDVPTLDVIGAEVLAALDAMPHPPTEVVAEPGRALVAGTGVIGAEIIGREMRDGRPWIYLEVGAYNGLMEAAQSGARWPYPVLAVDAATGRPLDGTPRVPMTVTGPTCDSTDTVLADVMLPDDVAVGDVLHLGGTGAYTITYASHFNGFPPPTPVIVA